MGQHLCLGKLCLNPLCKGSYLLILLSSVYEDFISDKKWQSKTIKSNTKILMIIAIATQDLFIEVCLSFQYPTQFLVIKEACPVLVC